MSSISTKRGDSGQTSLAGGVRVSKASLRVAAYGDLDELISSLGCARAMTDDQPVAELTARIQRELFSVGSILATSPNGLKKPHPLDPALVEALTAEVHRIEAIEGVLSDWAIPGGHGPAAFFDAARTVCRRAERSAVALAESGEPVEATVLAYLNRLSDLLWLIGRKLEHDAGVNISLRTFTGQKGNRWSRAW
jgi:cob(I)alamin adenosyltransferase